MRDLFLISVSSLHHHKEALPSLAYAHDAQKFVGSSRFRARTFESENLRFEARGVKPRLLSRG